MLRRLPHERRVMLAKVSASAVQSIKAEFVGRNRTHPEP